MIWYYKEWRLIGNANDKMKAPNVKCIYLGKNISDENRKKIIEFANMQQICIVQLWNNKIYFYNLRL